MTFGRQARLNLNNVRQLLQHHTQRAVGLDSELRARIQKSIQTHAPQQMPSPARGQSLAQRAEQLYAQVGPRVARAFNEMSGYDKIDGRKRLVEAHAAQLRTAVAALDSARLAYEESIDERRKCQKELNSLLQRKDSWVDVDISRFTDLYRRDLTLENTEASTKLAYKQASAEYDSANKAYLDQIRERYIDEQLYSDKIRTASTWWTVGLISVHLIVFLGVSIRDLFVKRRDRVELVRMVKEVLEEEAQETRLALKETVSAAAGSAAADLAATARYSKTSGLDSLHNGVDGADALRDGAWTPAVLGIPWQDNWPRFSQEDVLRTGIATVSFVVGCAVGGLLPRY